jgi:uncharacterized membrane protein YjdF
MLDLVAYTVAGLVLYFVSDWILNQIEIRRGERFGNRSLVFFAIIMVLALGLFELIKRI